MPLAGKENPYQSLMLDGLRSRKSLQVRSGAPGKIFPFFRTAFRDRPDVIHLDWLHQYYLRASKFLTWISYPVFVLDLVLAKTVFGVKFVWTLHNVHPHAGPNYGPYRWPRQFFARRCEWIRVFSNSTVERASAKLNTTSKKFIVIPEGSYLGYYPDTIDRATARLRFELQEELTLLFIGGIKPYKGLEDLIAAFKKLGEGGKVKLLIAGATLDLKYASKIKKLVEDEQDISFFPGLVAVEEIQYFMKAADLVVLPFKKIENSGTAILAMGFAKAVLAPAQGVLPYRLSAQQELLYGDDLSAALSQAIRIPHERLKTYGDNNKRNLEKHQWSDFANAF